MVYGPVRGQWFGATAKDSTVEGRWPKTSVGLNWYEIPISSAFSPEMWERDPTTAARRMRRLVFGIPPDHYQGTVGQAYKVMRETFRKWEFPLKHMVTHIQLREGGSWHFSLPYSIPKDQEIHLTFEFFGTDPNGVLVKLNGTVHGYQQDEIDFDNEFRAQFSAYVAGQNAVKGTGLPLQYDNRCGTLEWVPDPANFDSLYEHPAQLKEQIDNIHDAGEVSDLTAEIRMRNFKPLPRFPGLPQPPVNPQATIIPSGPYAGYWTTAAPTGTAIAQTPNPWPSLPPVIARMQKKKNFPQTSQKPSAPGGASDTQASNTGGSAASAIGQASPRRARWSPYSLGPRAQQVEGIYRKVAAGRFRIHKPATMLSGSRRLLVPVQPSPA